MNPTNDDLKRMVDDAAKVMPPLVDDEPEDLALDALAAIKAILLCLASVTTDWAKIRQRALQAMYFCGLAAWHAGAKVQHRVGSLVDGTEMGIDLNGTHRPFGLSANMKSAPEKTDVDALLQDCDMLAGLLASADRRVLFRDIAAALRAERARADKAVAELIAEDEAHTNTRAEVKRLRGRLEQWAEHAKRIQGVSSNMQAEAAKIEAVADILRKEAR